MSQPDTNLKKQKRWHRGPLFGMALAVVLAVVVAVGIMFYRSSEEGSRGSETVNEESGATDIREGEIDLPDDAPTKTVEPADPDVEVVE